MFRNETCFTIRPCCCKDAYIQAFFTYDCIYVRLIFNPCLGGNQESFRAGEVSWNKSDSIKISSTTHKIEALHRVNVGDFSPRYT